MRDMKKSPSVIPFRVRIKHANNPTMTLRKTNMYDTMENNRLEVGKEKSQRKQFFTIDLVNEEN